MEPIRQCFDEAWKNVSIQNGEQEAEGAEAVAEGQEVDEEVAVVSVKKGVLEGCETVDEALTAAEQTLILRRKEIAEVEERRNRYLETNEVLVRQNLRMRNELEDLDEQRLRIEEALNAQRENLHSYKETELSYIQEERSSLQMERTQLQAERSRSQVERSRMNEERLSLVELRRSVKAAILHLEREYKPLDDAVKLIAQQGQVMGISSTSPDSGLHSKAEDTAHSTREGSMEPNKP
ncbi:unnamed protein product [Orchesella dallaii]|uniref:Uncharacterized protein n=1 Tax=Orchesella dallaii TaxID=48710 RepID=A0ABP1RT32_9HEXA